MDGRAEMPTDVLHDLICQPSGARPVLLEGQWLGERDGCWWAANPVSLLEGSGAAFDALPAWLVRHAAQFPHGAAIGFVSYELARHLERLVLPVQPNLPDISFAYYPQIASQEIPPYDATEPCDRVRIQSNFDFETYQRAVQRIRAYIVAGDIYQANLTMQFSAALGDDRPELIYRRLRCSGAPFRAFIKAPERTIVSNSPERFFRVRGDRILTSPIKGTMARDGNDTQRCKSALIASEKDRAENLMIVDLLRNDLGRICDFASIRARLWQTEALPQLIHLVSHVEGTLRAGVGILDILRALFPGGSITGAPKIRAMEILAEIEHVPRGISMGAIGIIRSVADSARWRMDFNVAIRTMVIGEGKASFNVGGGIVYDSNADSEYAEVMLKAQPLFAVLGARDTETIRKS